MRKEHSNGPGPVIVSLSPAAARRLLDALRHRCAVERGGPGLRPGFRRQDAKRRLCFAPAEIRPAGLGGEPAAAGTGADLLPAERRDHRADRLSISTPAPPTASPPRSRTIPWSRTTARTGRRPSSAPSPTRTGRISSSAGTSPAAPRCRPPIASSRAWNWSFPGCGPAPSSGCCSESPWWSGWCGAAAASAPPLRPAERRRDRARRCPRRAPRRCRPRPARPNRANGPRRRSPAHRPSTGRWRRLRHRRRRG